MSQNKHKINKSSLILPEKFHDTEPPKRQWIVQNLIPQGHVTSLYGAGGVGKSLLSLQMMLNISLGSDFFGLKTKKVKTLGLFCEDDKVEILNRLHSISQESKLSLNQFNNNCFIVSGTGNGDNMMASFDYDSRLVKEEMFEKIEKFAKEEDCRFIVIDNISNVFAGNEVDRSHVSQFISSLNKLAQEINGAVLLCGHPSKDGSGYSGSTAWNNAVRSRVTMTKKKKESYIELSHVKSNYSKIVPSKKLKVKDGFLYEVESEDLEKEYSDLLDLLLNFIKECFAKGKRLARSDKAGYNNLSIEFKKHLNLNYDNELISKACDKLLADNKIKIGTYKSSNGAKREIIIPS